MRHWTFGGPRHQAQHEEALKQGLLICRECGAPTKPPRRSWCSDECVKTYRERCRPVRDLVFERDDGICAICGTDTVDREARTRSTLYMGEWDADHIVPLCEGGEHSLQNLRTLCKPCHKTVTAELRQRLKGRAA